MLTQNNEKACKVSLNLNCFIYFCGVSGFSAGAKQGGGARSETMTLIGCRCKDGDIKAEHY